MTNEPETQSNLKKPSRQPRNGGRGALHAFEQFCDEIETPLFTYLLKLVKNRAEAEDLAQETLLRVFTAETKRQIRNGTTGRRTFTFSIAHNLAVDFLRKNSRKPPPPSPAPQPSKSVDQTLIREQLDQAFTKLPGNQASAIMLREFGELTYAEIAEIHSVSVGTVKTWIYRARQHLAQLLDRDGQYIGDKRHGM